MKIVVYSKDDCRFCKAATDLLRVIPKDFNEYKLGKDFSRELIKQVFPDANTFPVVTIDGNFIGGYSELVAYLNENTK